MQNNEDKGSLTDRFREFGAAPSDGLWDAISEQLEEKKKRRFVIWWWFSGLAASLLVIGVVVLAPSRERHTSRSISDTQEQSGNAAASQTVQGRGTTKKQPEQNTTAANTTDSEQGSVGSDFHGSEQTPVRGKQVKPSHEQRTFSEQTIPSNASTDIPLTQEPVAQPETAQEISSEAISSDSLAAQTSDTDSIPSTDVPEIVEPDLSDIILPPAPNYKWMIGAQIGFMAGNTVVYGPNGALSIADGNNAFPPSYAMAQSASSIHEHQYWYFQLTAQRRFCRRFWLESGLEIGNFRSGSLKKSNGASSSSYTLIAASSWTAGIPIGLNYDLFEGRKLTVFAGAGILNQFPFYRHIHYTQAGGTTSTDQRSYALSYVSALQWKVGVRYRISPKLAIELVPSGRYYYHYPVGNNQEAPALKGSFWFGGTAGMNWSF